MDFFVMFLKTLLNKSIYNGFSQTLMRQRGILRNTETISDAFSRVINAISEVDQNLYEKNNSLNSHSASLNTEILIIGKH